MNNFEHDSTEDGELEITNLDEGEENKQLSLSSKSGEPQFKLRIRLLMAIGLVIGCILLLRLLIVPAITPHQAFQEQTLPSPTPAAVNIYMTDNVVYVSKEDGSIESRRASNGFLLWRYKSSGGALESFSPTDSIIYVIVQKGQQGIIEALRANDGSELWSYRVLTSNLQLLTIEEGLVYLISQEGTLFALQASSGSLRWHYTNGQFLPDSTILRVTGEEAYVTAADNTLYVLRTRDGSLLWYRPLGTNGYAFATPIAGSDLIYIDGQDGLITMLRASNGSLIWNYKSNRSALWAADVENGIVYASTETGSVKALKAFDGTELWNYTAGGIISDQPIAVGGVLYLRGANDNIYALRTRDGSLLWHFTPPNGYLAIWPLQIVDGAVYVSLVADFDVSKGAIYALQERDGRLKWQHNAGKLTPYIHLSIINEVMYVSEEDGSMDAVRVKDGFLLWHYVPHAPILWDLTATHDLVYISAQDGTLDVLRISDGSLRWHYP